MSSFDFSRERLIIFILGVGVCVFVCVSTLPILNVSSSSSSRGSSLEIEESSSSAMTTRAPVSVLSGSSSSAVTTRAPVSVLPGSSSSAITTRAPVSFLSRRDQLRPRGPVEEGAHLSPGFACDLERSGTEWNLRCPTPLQRRKRRARVFDCFPYGGEREMLAIRLLTLANVVDYFMIAEGEQTMSGVSKPRHLWNDLQNGDPVVSQFADRIIYVDVPNTTTSTGWDREWFQRQMIPGSFSEYNISDDDVVILADCDEIPRPELVRLVSESVLPRGAVVRAMMHFFYYTFFWECPFLWEIRIVSASLFGNVARPVGGEIHEARTKSNRDVSFGDLRRGSRVDVFVRNNGGWHCSWCFSLDEIIRKWRAHTEYESVPQVSRVTLEGRYKNGLDPLGRNIRYVKVCPNNAPYFFALPLAKEARFQKLVNDTSKCRP